MNKILAEAANNARGLAIDAIHKCSSGHLGLPLGSAEIGAVLYGNSLSHDPSDPKWINRDRFILSAGHGSMFLYGWLHISGYDLSLEEVKNFRQLGSKTPGHPEYAETPGVEATTGPLGQGIGNAVGYAVSGKMAAARFNTDDHEIFNHHVFALAGDGCLQEGVAAEAAAFAGHFNLDNLILLYDSNDVTLDAMAVKTQTEDTGVVFKRWVGIRRQLMVMIWRPLQKPSPKQNQTTAANQNSSYVKLKLEEASQKLLVRLPAMVKVGPSTRNLQEPV